MTCRSASIQLSKQSDKEVSLHPVHFHPVVHRELHVRSVATIQLVNKTYPIIITAVLNQLHNNSSKACVDAEANRFHYRLYDE